MYGQLADYTEENWPLGYAVFVAASSKSPEYADGMTILAYMRYDEVKQWENTYNIVGKEEDAGKAMTKHLKKERQKLTR